MFFYILWNSLYKNNKHYSKIQTKWAIEDYLIPLQIIDYVKI
jgi:hypothetical protein